MKRTAAIVLALTTFALLAGYRSSAAPDRLHYVTTAHQAGPVGFRDPIGTISPDGSWLAYISNRHLYLHRIQGSTTTELLPDDNMKIALAWLPDSHHLAVQENAFASEPKCFQYEIDSGKRESFSSNLSKLSWPPDAPSLAGISSSRQGNERWVARSDGTGGRGFPSAASIAWPIWTPDSQNVACLTTLENLQRIMLPCADSNAKPVSGSGKAWGSFAFSPDRRVLYYSSANSQGTLDLWSRDLASGRATQLSHFARDTYAPSVTATGDVLFKTQVCRAFVGVIPTEGGAVHAISTFTSETPTWSPDGAMIGLTFGNWRRIVDDAHYPDITQDLGIILFDEKISTAEPARIFQASDSEDQGMSWSPNGKWIAFHSHQNRTDDIFLQRADGSEPVQQITKGGTETGWPRWSPDGRWIAYSSYPGPNRATRSKLYVLGIDQDSGAVTQPATPIAIAEFTEDADAPNWTRDSAHLVFESHGDVPGRKALHVVERTGGRPQKIVDYTSDQVYSGISVSSDGKWVAYVAQAADGIYQIFRIPVSGGTPQQMSFDGTNKTQPAFSPDGKWLAFTIWQYDVQFWLMKPDR